MDASVFPNLQLHPIDLCQKSRNGIERRKPPQPKHASSEVCLGR
jgi:hypothetical protein